MKQRLLEGCKNPAKLHMWRLPSVPPTECIEPYVDISKECVVIFPLFQIRREPLDISLEHHLVRAACWAKRSWIQYSDARELGIHVGFYVGDTVVDRVKPILAECGEDPDRIFVFEEAPFEDVKPHLGKKLAMWGDPQFAEYKWVLQMDCDMFLASKDENTCNFFEYIINHEEIPGSICAYLQSFENVQHRMLKDYHWWQNISEDDDETKLQLWRDRATDLTNEAIVNTYFRNTYFNAEVHGGCYAMPARHFMKYRKADCEWLYRAGQMLQDDEAVFSLWHTKGGEMFSITHETEIAFVAQIETFMADRQLSDPYFSHIGNMAHEILWRQDIDAY